MTHTPGHLRQIERKVAAFTAALDAALPHRHVAASVGQSIAQVLRLSLLRGRLSSCYVTHTSIARRRGHLHRNTSRDVLREAAELGLCTLGKYHPDAKITLTIHWRAVFAMLKGKAAAVFTAARPRSEADWQRDVAAWKAAKLAQARQERDADRKHAAAMRDAQAANAVELRDARRAALEALRGHHGRLWRPPAFVTGAQLRDMLAALGMAAPPGLA